MTGILFSSEELARLVHETLPADARPHEHVVVGTVDLTGAQILASFKHEPLGTDFGCRWELQAAARHDWTSGDNNVGARVLLRW
jgi:hypothetical protein